MVKHLRIGLIVDQVDDLAARSGHIEALQDEGLPQVHASDPDFINILKPGI